MDAAQDLITELHGVTQELAGTVPPDSGEFAQLLRRRGELIRRLCSGAFDPRDIRVQTILREGEQVLHKARLRQDLLKTEAASLELLTAFCGGIKSTIPRAEPAGIDITA